jgi:hypothetical protein
VSFESITKRQLDHTSDPFDIVRTVLCMARIDTNNVARSLVLVFLTCAMVQTIMGRLTLAIQIFKIQRGFDDWLIMLSIHLVFINVD